MDVRRGYGTSILRYVEKLDLAQYPDIRNPELDDLLILAIVDLARKKEVSVEIRHIAGDGKSSQFAVYAEGREVASIWAKSDRASGRPWYHLTTKEDVDSVNIDFPEDQTATSQTNLEVKQYGQSPNTYESVSVAIGGQEIWSWINEVISRAQKVPVKPNRRLRIPLIWT